MLTETQKMIIVAVIGFGLGFGGCFIWLSGKDARLAKSIGSIGENATNTEAALKGAMQEKVDSLKEQIRIKEQEINTGVTATLETPSSASVASVISATASISTHNQKAGNKAYVDNVTFSSPGWLVAYEYTGGKLGRILGAYYRGVGTYSNLDVDLVKNTVAGSTYAVVVSSDDGDKNYDYRKDVPVVDSSGKTILATFTALEN